MSAAENKAVFLSYASQDAAAAEQIAEALRAAGVEVWFDRNELVGGDAWDAKIRRQIAECALFVPIISASTQARLEGYFRIEWKLAAQRTHAMADEKAFLLPLVIDATRDAEAKVPTEFKAVQWTRLPDGEAAGRFGTRVRALLDAEARGGSREAFAPSGAALTRSATKPAPPRSGSRSLAAIVGIALLVAAVAIVALRPRRSPEEASVTAQAPQAVRGAPAPHGPVSEAVALTTKAYAITQRIGFTREDLALAEASTQRAVELEPDSARASSVHAWVRACYLMRNWDTGEKRLQEVQADANRALGLDPNDADALNALAQVFEKQRIPAEAEKVARRAVAASADNYRAWILLGRAQEAQGRASEAGETLQQAVARFPDNPLCRYELANHFVALGTTTRPFVAANLTTALEQLETAITLRPFASAILVKAVWEVAGRGDLGRMRAELDRLETLPVTDRTEDRAVFIAMWGGLLERQPERVLAAAKLTARAYFEDAIVAGPKAWGTAQAYHLAGKQALARQEWAAAEAVLRQRLKEQPSEIDTARLATTLAWEGDTAGAERLMAPIEAAWREDLTKARARDLARYYAARGEAAKAGPFLREILNFSSFITDALLPLDPWWDKLRGQPEFEALLAEARARAAGGGKASPAPSGRR